MRARNRKNTILAYAIALALHGILLSGTMVARVEQSPLAIPRSVRIHIPATLEGQPPEPAVERPVAALPTPDVQPPESIETPEPVPTAGTSNLPTPEELAAERDELRKQLEAEMNIADFRPSKLPAPPPPSAMAESRGRGPKGAIRELNFDDAPQSQVDAVMKKYKLRTAMQQVSGRSNQHFLSSAVNREGEQYTAHDRVSAGVYEVFLLSPEALAHMAHLEEQAIRSRGMEPERTRIIRIEFGIENTAAGPDLTVSELEAEPIPGLMNP